MTVTLKYSLMACAFLLGGCSSSVSPGAGTPLAEVNGSFLYEEDVDRVMPVGLHGADSVNFVKQYVRDWVEDVLLYKKAKDNVPDNQRIEELVSSYRKTLIMHTYQEELVKQKLSGAITDAEVEQYYNQNPELFRADAPYIKGLFVKVPVNVPNLNTLRGWCRKNVESNIDRLEKFCVGTAVNYDYFFDRWLPVSDFASKMPLAALKSNPGYLSNDKNVEVKDSLFCYILHVEQFLPKGEILPLEYAQNEIKEILVNQKRTEFINQMKSELYREASEDKKIKYYKTID